MAIDALRASLQAANAKLDALPDQLTGLQGSVDSVQQEVVDLIALIGSGPGGVPADVQAAADAINAKLESVSSGLQVIADDLASTPKPPAA